LDEPESHKGLDDEGFPGCQAQVNVLESLMVKAAVDVPKVEVFGRGQQN